VISEVLQILVQCIEFIWPFHIVEQWERGRFYCFGRMYFGELGPGLYPIFPWFTRIINVDVVPSIIGTGRQDITLRDERTLSFAATATVKVIDANLALNSVDQYKETTRELMASFLAQELAETDADRLSPDKRPRLFTTLEARLAKETAKFGVELTNLRFTSFVLDARTYRLLTDAAAAARWLNQD
jgi:regulator of protease activity HflC (stomatin/prohibitin superfamily)